MLGRWTSQVNGQDQIVQSGNYCYSSFRVMRLKYNHWKITMTLTQKMYPNHIILRTDKKKWCILLKVELWPLCLKNQLQNSKTNKNYLNVKVQCPWCNGYRHRKWIQRHEFKSWTRVFAFHIALIPLGKVWIQLFSLQLWVNSRTDWVL